MIRCISLNNMSQSHTRRINHRCSSLVLPVPSCVMVQSRLEVVTIEASWGSVEFGNAPRVIIMANCALGDARFSYLSTQVLVRFDF